MRSAPRAEESARGASVRVPVVGDVPHVIVYVVLADLGQRDLAQARPHVLDVLGRRSRAMPAPHHHRHVTDIALGDPADVVLVIPRRHARRAAEIAALDPLALVRTGRHGSPHALAGGRWRGSVVMTPAKDN